MNFILTDYQAALNRLLVATRETVDHYRDATELVEQKIKRAFQEIVIRRNGFIVRLEEYIRESGVLPAMPDPDKEASEMLLHHLGALIKDHYEVNALEQRIASEQKLAELLAETQANSTAPAALLSELNQHILETIKQLELLQTELPRA